MFLLAKQQDARADGARRGGIRSEPDAALRQTAAAAVPQSPGLRPALNAPGSRHEREADRAANGVASGRAPLHAGCTCGGSCPRCRAARAARAEMRGNEAAGAPTPTGGRFALQLSPAGAASPAAAPATPARAPAPVRQVLGEPGEALPPATRALVETRFGADFSGVRLHTGGSAARAARSMGARAFAAGSHVVFGAGEFAPETGNGLHLLAHELAHTLQQRPQPGTALAGGLTRADDGVVQGAVPPAVVAALAILLATGACALPWYLYAMRTYGRKTDKWRHCYVSCQMAKTCGPILTEFAGLGKEIRDRAVAAFCGTYPSNSICTGGHADIWDSLADLGANQRCIAWETVLVGPIARLWRQGCDECCDAAGL